MFKIICSDWVNIIEFYGNFKVNKVKDYNIEDCIVDDYISNKSKSYNIEDYIDEDIDTDSDED